MSTDTTEDLVSRGHEALALGDWDSARDAFTAALERGSDPEASVSLGRTLWWLGDVDAAIDYRERAYASFRKRGDAVRAARIALWLAREYVEAVGNEPAGNGWLARAQGLLRDVEPDPAHGWLDLTLGSRSFDPAQMRAHAETALGTARRSTTLSSRPRPSRSSAAHCFSVANSTPGSPPSTSRWSRPRAVRSRIPSCSATSAAW